MYEFYTKVAGTTFEGRDEVIEELYLTGNLDIGQELLLQRQPYNQYDRNAIAVIHPKTNEQVGFIPKNTSANLAPIMDSGIRCRALVSAVTGGNDYNYGINLKIIEQS